MSWVRDVIMQQQTDVCLFVYRLSVELRLLQSARRPEFRARRVALGPLPQPAVLSKTTIFHLTVAELAT